MSNWKLIRLNFEQTPAHFGEVGIGIEETSERVRSDTLFSAWMSAYARLYEKDAIENLLNQINQSPLFYHSSTFIYRCDRNNYTYYLPKPLIFPPGYPVDDDLKLTKTYKKISYLPLSIWQRWYQGEGLTISDQQELENATTDKPNPSGELFQAGLFDYKESYKIHTLPKVAIDRLSSATNFYHTGFVHFEGDSDRHSGLYFLLYFPKADVTLENQLHSALHLLAEEGLGGERSSGAGRFKLEWLELTHETCQAWQKIELETDFNPRHRCLISLFWDDNQYILNPLVNHKNTRYEIQERGGWIASPFSGRQLRRKMVRMFAEGSVFPLHPQGKLADVTPEAFHTHPIYRSGICLSLPIKLSN